MIYIFVYLCIFVATAADSNKNCNKILTDDEGIIQSPRYPQPYANYLNCSWRITVSGGKLIVLKTKRFELEYSYNCESDALYIYDGPDERSNLYSKPYCDRNGPKDVSSSKNSLFLRFITDKLDNARGFSIQYHSVKICDYEFRQNNGSFTSPGFPLNYYKNANCSYRIITGKHKAILLRFHDFHLENKVKGKCLDYVSIYDVLDTGPRLLRRLCGEGIPSPIQSSSNEMLIKFHSDKLINSPGFNVTFYSVFHVCAKDQFKCSNGRCININLLCNDVNDCLDNTDEVFCSCDRFKCENKRCISHAFVCDQQNHCGDWSDEKYCPTSSKSPAKKITTMKTTNMQSTTMIPTTTPFPTCGYTQFKCLDNTCIEAISRCNGENNCKDGGDETDCYGQCRNMNGGCQHICDYDRRTGVKCSCYKGFQLDSDRKSCIDINECSSRPCESSCSNMYGSYTCGCNIGYRLAANKRSCIDFNECSLQNGQCEQHCINNVGSFQCACFDGYVFDQKTNGCVDINECQINNGGCGEKCVNTVGSFQCECNQTGYVMVSGKKYCEEVNECELGTASCAQICINTKGSYKCSCHTGYHLHYDEHNCIDEDECLEGSAAGCWGTCINTPGSYRCKCDIGFREILNDTKCQDINECKVKNGGCSNLCFNTLGSFECKCHNGFVAKDSRSFTCEDRNECNENPCEEQCINTPGSFICLCKPGYQTVNQTKCEDVNECYERNDCTFRCTNIPGSFFCTCPDGFILDSNKRTCITAVNGTGCPRIKINTAAIQDTDWSNVTGGWAWQASLSVDFGFLNVPRFKCIGILVSNEFVLTTGHCVEYGRAIRIEAEQLLVSLGRYSYGYRNSEINIRAKKVIRHPTLDVALLQLSKIITFGKHIKAVCLPQGEHDVDISKNRKIVTVTWPSTDIIHNRLQQVYTTIDDPSTCKWNNENIFKQENILCVKSNLRQPVLPMSGAPLLGMLRGTLPTRKRQKWFLTGILIYGDCYPGERKTYSLVYRHIAYHKVSKFAQWIRDKTKIP